jgi:peptide/nickel transport system permease protein
VIGYILRRLLAAVPIVLSVATATFFLLKLAPGDPVRAYLGEKASATMVDQLRHAWGLDRPLLVQYGEFLLDLVRGHLGESFIYREPVATVISARLGVTLLLMVVSVVFAVLISVPLALWVTMSRRRTAGIVVRLLTATVQGMPLFFIGTLLITVLALRLPIFPVGGYGDTTLEHLHSLVLPALAIALGIAPTLIRSLIASLGQSFEAQYISFGRAKGLPEREVVVHHALRNSSISAVSILGIQVGQLVGGALVVENVFAVPGLGSLLLSSVVSRDFPVVQALTIIFGVIVVLVYLLTDVAYASLDPRVRLGKR